MLCESPTELEGSNDVTSSTSIPQSIPSSLRSPSPPPDPLVTSTQKSRSTTWTFGRTHSISAQSIASTVWRRRPPKDKDKEDVVDADPCPTPKSILKKTSIDTSEAASIMSGISHTSHASTPSFRTASSMGSTSAAASTSRPAKRVTWIDPVDIPPVPVPVRVRQNIRRHSVDAVDRVAKAATSLASMAAGAIPFPLRRQVEEYEWSSSEEEEEERRPSPDIDWVAYGRAYTEEDVLREYPPLYVNGDRRAPSSRTSSDTVVGRPRRAIRRATGDNSDESDAESVHWDATRMTTPAWLLEGKYRPKSDRPVFGEDDDDDDNTHGALARPAKGLAPSLASCSSIDSELVVTPSASMLLPPPVSSEEPAGAMDNDELPDGAVILVPKPVRVSSRPSLR